MSGATHDTAVNQRENTPQNVAKLASLSLTNDPATSTPASKTARKRSASKAKKRSIPSDPPGSPLGPLPFGPLLTIAYPTRVPVPAWLHDVAYATDPIIPVATRLGHEMLAFTEYTHQVMERLELALDDAIDTISACVQSIWPEATVTCYGSFANGLWLPSSDVDVVVMGILQHDSTSTGTGTKLPARRFVQGSHELHQIADQLRKQAWVQQIEVVGSAKVPVAKLVLVDSDLRVDISIENAHTLLGIEASDLVRGYITAMPILHPLILVLKQFLREKGLNNAFTGGLSSYCVALMAFYLVERQQATTYVGADVGVLLLDFLEFYGTNFHYATTGISLKPEAFGEYYLSANFTIGSDGVPLLLPQLVIDDPVYPDGQHNAAAGAFGIARVIAALESAYYAVSFHRPSKFTPTPLSQLLHWSGYTNDRATGNA